MSGVVAGRLFVVGGSTDAHVLASAESFIPGQANWEPLPCMATARQDALSCVVSGSLYICGGITSEWEDLNVVDSSLVERFRCDCNTWELLPAMSAPLARHFSVSCAMA